MTQPTSPPQGDRPDRRSDAEALLERLADEGLSLDTSLAELLALLDRRHERLAAGGAR